MKRKIVILVIGASLMILALSCKRTSQQSTAEESPTPPRPTASPLTGFARDLQFIKNGQYTYVWVFSRKDGKPLDKEDGAFLRTNAPQVVDWVTTDEGKKVIAGTNFDLQKGNLDKLKKQFVVEDYSHK